MRTPPIKMRLTNQFKALKNDRQRWKWVLKHRSQGIVVIMDNDETYLSIPEEDYENWLDFDESLGNMPGIVNLLEVLNIQGNGV